MLNFPNLLSLVRLILVPFFPIVFYSGDKNAMLYAAIIYVTAVITDVLDGYVARKYRLITKLGKVLDPLADKLMSFTVVVCLAQAGVIPIWVVLILFIKEMLMGVGALFLYKKVNDVIVSNIFGKAATVLIFAVCTLLLLVKDVPGIVSNTLISAALLCTLIAFFSYLRKFLQISKSNNKTV